MIDSIKKMLGNANNIDDWKIVFRNINSDELFFIRKGLDMDRAKDVEHIELVIYKDFIENGVKYRGSSSVKIHPAMDEAEIKNAIEAAAFAAGFVKNKYYPVALPQNGNAKIPDNSDSDFGELLPSVVNAIFKDDVFEDGGINSAELFMKRIHTRILNSRGVDISYETLFGELELITNWKGPAEEVELYKHLEFAGFNPDLLCENTREMLAISRERAYASPTPISGNCTVLLTGESVTNLFNYYYMHSGASLAYERISTVRPGDCIQGTSVSGDLINMSLDPCIEDSSESAPYDNDGFPLEPVTIIEKGILKRYWGSIRYCSYLGVEPTGVIGNIIIDGGSKSINDMKAMPYLEILVFSDFQMDPVTGSFGGEIRLGRYYDGSSTISVTGGSISGNIKDVEKEMYFSRELQKNNNYTGPKAVQLFNISVSGQ